MWAIKFQNNKVKLLCIFSILFLNANFQPAASDVSQFSFEFEQSDKSEINSSACTDHSFPYSKNIAVQLPVINGENIMSVTTIQRKYSLAKFASPIREVKQNLLLSAVLKLLTHWGADNIDFICDQTKGISTPDVHHFFSVRNLNYDILTIHHNGDIETKHIHKFAAARYIVFLCRDDLSEEMFFKLSLSDVFYTMHTWIVVSSVVPAYFYMDFFKSFITTFNSQVTHLMPKKNEIDSHMPTVDLDIFDVFYSHHSNSVEIINFATFTLPNQFKLLKRSGITTRKRKLTGREVRILAFTIAPYCIIDKQKGTLHGYLPEVYFTLGKFFNIIYNVTISDDPTYGIELNGKFTGFVGKHQRGETDITLTVLIVTQSRKQAIHYSCAVTRSYITLFMKSPGSKVPPTIYFLPFGGLVWLCIVSGCLMCFVTVTIIAVVKVSPTVYVRNCKKKIAIIMRLSIEYIQNVLDNPPGVSGKILLGTLLIAGMMIFSYYCSVFTSFLTYREVKLPISTLDDLVANRNYKILLVNQTMHQEYIQKATEGVMFNLWRRIVAQGASALVNGFTQGYYRMLTGKYVYITDGPSTIYLAKDNCDVAYSNVKYFREFYHMAFRKDFPYTSLYSSSILKLMEGGILSRLEKLHLKPNRETCIEQNASQTIELLQTRTLFLLLLVSIGLSLITLLIEILVHHCNK